MRARRSRSQGGSRQASNAAFFIDDVDNPYTGAPGTHFNWIQGNVVGGRSMARQSYRMIPDGYELVYSQDFADDSAPKTTPQKRSELESARPTASARLLGRPSDMSDTPESPGSSGPSVHLAQFSIVLVVNQIDPSIFNPDFLRHNQIVDPDSQVSEPPTTTPQFAQVRFKDAVAVKVDPKRVIFEQTGDPLQPRELRPPGMAMRFATLFPNVVYKAIGINPTGVPFLDGAVDHRVHIRDILLDQGQWLCFNNARPKLNLHAAYRLPDKNITLDVLDADSSEPEASPRTIVAFRANIHRELQETDQIERNQHLLSVLAKWDEDLKDFEALVTNFISKSTTP